MKTRLAPAALLLLVLQIAAYSQRQAAASPPPPVATDPVGSISTDVSRIANSMEGLKRNWTEFFKAFSTNQGLQLNERQQKILLALEVLNRGEQRIANLQKMRTEHAEKLAALKLSLARNADDLLPESVERYIALRGTTDAEGLRDMRRQALQRERNELTNLSFQVQRDLDRANADIEQTEFFLRNIRARLYPEIDKELADL
jgi:hypothetical protein